jgi:1,2-diacylglycerol 3-beta-galactosyltransferase
MAGSDEGRGVSGRPRVLLFTIDAGGGHRAAARALAAAVEEVCPGFELRVESFQQVLLPLDLLRRLTGLSLEDGYNLILRQHWSAFMVPLLRVMHGAIALRRGAVVRTLASWLRQQPRPAAVVSVFPNFNGIIREALASAHPGVPLVVVLTDFADFPPRFWIEPGLDRVIVASDEAERQARAIGVSPASLSRVSGMVLHPSFYRSAQAHPREAVRSDLGLSPEQFVLMMLFGGKGSPEMEPLARELLAREARLRLIAVCGDNPGLHRRLSTLAEGTCGRLLPFGFTDRMAELMAASDLLVTKPGPGSLAEAFHQCVPVVVTRNRHTIPQERFNTDFVRDRQLGVVVQHWREIPGAVVELQNDPERRAAIRQRLAALPRNRAVYEVLEVLAREIAAGS